MSEQVGERVLVDDRAELTFDDVVEARVTLVGGDLALAAGPAPARVEVEVLTGPPVEVELDRGTLRVGYRDPEADRGRREAVVTLVLPPEAIGRANTVSAPVLVGGLDRRVTVNTVSGSVTLNRLDGDVDVNTVSAAIAASHLRGTLRARTVSGGLTLVRSSCRSVSASTVSGTVTLDLDPAPDGDYRVNTVSGPVTVRLPDDAGVDVDLSTMSGRVDSAFDLAHHGGRFLGRGLSGRIGGGGAALSARTMSGSFALLRRARAGTVA